MATAATTKVTSAIASFRRSVSQLRASSPLTAPPASGDVGRKSLDEAEPLQQLSKLDVVVWNGAEQENQLEPALNGLLRHRERSSRRERSGRSS